MHHRNSKECRVLPGFATGHVAVIVPGKVRCYVYCDDQNFGCTRIPVPSILIPVDVGH